MEAWSGKGLVPLEAHLPFSMGGLLLDPWVDLHLFNKVLILKVFKFLVEYHLLCYYREKEHIIMYKCKIVTLTIQNIKWTYFILEFIKSTFPMEFQNWRTNSNKGI